MGNVIYTGLILTLFIGIYLLSNYFCSWGMFGAVVFRCIIKPIWFFGVYPIVISLSNYFIFDSKELAFCWVMVPFVSCVCFWLMKTFNEGRVLYRSKQLKKELKKTLGEKRIDSFDINDWYVWVYPNKRFYMIYCKYPEGFLSEIDLTEEELGEIVRQYYSKIKIDLRISAIRQRQEGCN